MSVDQSEALRAMARRCGDLRQELAEAEVAAGAAWSRVWRLENDERHARHGAWRRWRFTRWLLGWAYQLGVISGWGTTSTSACTGCVSRICWRGQRYYVLGLPRDTWRCLLVGHHRPGEPVGFGMCGKCLPCPECGSTTATCEPGCRL